MTRTMTTFLFYRYFTDQSNPLSIQKYETVREESLQSCFQSFYLRKTSKF